MSKYKICGVDLDDIHAVLIEILDEVDRVCKKNNIKYFLSGGTLLGSIRHKGFIPWDDDIDIWMTRKNFNKFKKAIKTELNDKYFSEDYFSNINFPLSILKIEKKGTRFVEGVFEKTDLAHCIYVDIFPLDNIWNPLYKLQTAILIKLQAVRDYKLRKNGKEKASRLKRLVYGAMPLTLCRLLTEATMRFFNIFPTKYKNQLCHRGRYWPKFVAAEIEDLIETDFAGKKYPIPRAYHKILTECYGDYMQMPPIDKQEPSHDIVECKLLERG